MTVVIIVCVCIAFYFLIDRYTGFAKGWNKFLQIMQPVLFGCLAAFLVNPIMKAYEKRILSKRLPKATDEKKRAKIIRSSRYLAIAAGLTTYLIIIAGLIALVLPQLIVNISGFVETVPGLVEKFTANFKEFAHNSEFSEQISTALRTVTNVADQYIKNTLMPQLGTYLSIFTSGVVTFLRFILNLFIGLMVAVYILAEKEKFKGQFKKIQYALFKPETGNSIITTLRKTNDIFAGFIVGKLIDSLIIGVIAFFALWIMQMPWPMLLASIIGITNVIPVFGPFIGGIPCAILIFLTDPLKALYFIIFIIILQQVDGNIIGPNILGNTTGVSSFWIITTILIGGGYFGILGMLLAVPVFGVIYYLFSRFIGKKLVKKELPVRTDDYVRADWMDPESKEIIYKEEHEESKKKKGFRFFRRRE
ncbi:MAG: AI-2E family transporter [Lachnospiraceae bacterium]|nr:AI-2E family transporter [Lachnospiraceae bacterium]